jgi:hypothetical protein
MPTYCYRKESGEIIEVTMTIDEMERKQNGSDFIMINGEKAKRDIVAEQSGYIPTYETWPRESDAAGTSPSQIPEEIAYAKKHGVNVSFTPDGRVVFPDRKTERQYCALHGLYQRNAGYSDATPDDTRRFQ